LKRRLACGFRCGGSPRPFTLDREFGIPLIEHTGGEAARGATGSAEIQEASEFLIERALTAKIFTLRAGALELTEFTFRQFAVPFSGQDLFEPVLIHRSHDLFGSSSFAL
jgi:hypothetical protein